MVTISDRDPKFTGDFWQALIKKLGRKTNMSTVDYAHTADGRAKRTNQTAITMMRQMVDYYQANWDELLPFVEFAINSHQSEGTGVSPFMVDMRREPKQPLNLEAPAQDDSLFISKIKSVLQQAKKLDEVRNGLRMDKILQQKRISKPFKVGDRVWVKFLALRDPTSADAGKKKL